LIAAADKALYAAKASGRDTAVADNSVRDFSPLIKLVA
jgi:GGDEF domain-containing protein